MHMLMDSFNVMASICTRYHSNPASVADLAVHSFPQYDLWSSELLKGVDKVWKKHMSSAFNDDGNWGLVYRKSWSEYVKDAVALIRSHAQSIASQEGIPVVREVAEQMADNASRLLIMDVESQRFPMPIITPTFIEDLHSNWSSVDSGLTHVGPFHIYFLCHISLTSRGSALPDVRRNTPHCDECDWRESIP